MDCIMSFFDLCMFDRFGVIIVGLLIFGLGYIFGTDGHWNRFYWRKKNNENKNI